MVRIFRKLKLFLENLDNIEHQNFGLRFTKLNLYKIVTNHKYL